MSKFIITTALLLINIGVFGQDLRSTLDIPKDLIENSDAVIRTNETIFTIENIGKSSIKFHRIVSILNQNGENKYGSLIAQYDKFSKVKNINGAIYDLYGKQLKSLKNNDIKDIGNGAFSNEVSDDRYKIAQFEKKNYAFPYTLEFSYEIEKTNMLFYPTWNPIDNENIAIESNKFSIIYPDGLKFKKKSIGNVPNQITTKLANLITETWELKNTKVSSFESFSLKENLPRIYFSPIDFKVGDYLGNMNSWEDLSKFYHNLNLNRDELSLEIKEKLDDLVKNIQDDYTKTKLVYEFLQSKTKYLSVQLGIGGWQCIPAMEVSKTGDGDCKALTNFMIAMLKYVKVKGYPVLVDSGTYSNKLYEDFPIMNFNHVIACVPMPKDTIWLECTSPKNPMGYQGDFTGNRKGLLVKEKGGKLINLTSYSSLQNSQKRNLKVKINNEGNASISVNTEYSGIQSETKTEVYESIGNEEQKEWLRNKINIPNFELNSLKSEIIKQKIPLLKEDLEIQAQKYASVNGERIFFKPNVFTNFFDTPKKQENRETDIYLNPNIYTFIDTDNAEISIPKGYKIEYLPKQINEENLFGKFVSKTELQDGVLKYTRFVEMKGGTFPKENYNKLIDFIKLVNKSDQQKIVLIKE